MTRRLVEIIWDSNQSLFRRKNGKMVESTPNPFGPPMLIQSSTREYSPGRFLGAGYAKLVMHMPEGANAVCSGGFHRDTHHTYGSSLREDKTTYITYRTFQYYHIDR